MLLIVFRTRNLVATPAIFTLRLGALLAESEFVSVNSPIQVVLGDYKSLTPINIQHFPSFVIHLKIQVDIYKLIGARVRFKIM